MIYPIFQTIFLQFVDELMPRTIVILELVLQSQNHREKLK